MNVEVECESCRGTGVYSGMAESEGVAVVCCNCEGSGKVRLLFRKFTGRKRAKGIQTVQIVRRDPLPDEGSPEVGKVTYEEFLSGKRPRLPSIKSRKK